MSLLNKPIVKITIICSIFSFLASYCIVAVKSDKDYMERKKNEIVYKFYPETK